MKTKRKSDKYWGFNLKNLDRSIRPQDDFFHFAMGGWLKTHPIPGAESRWGTFYVLRDEGLKKIRTVLDDLARSKSIKKGSEQQIIRDFYVSGMDMKTRNKNGALPLMPILGKIESIQSRDDLKKFITYAHQRGFSALWDPFVAEDEKNSERYATYLVQGGISLPDRDFYLKKDRGSEQIKRAFADYVQHLFVLLGENRQRAALYARQVLFLETQLARASMDKVECRNVEKTYNKKTLRELSKIAPFIDWPLYLRSLGLEKAKHVIIMQPNFIKKVAALIEERAIDEWKAYLRFMVANEAAPYLSQAFVNEQFAFYGKILAGNEKLRPNWKRVISTLNGTIGDAIGREYVKRYFPPEAKEKIEELVSHLIAAYKERIKNLDWMSDQTKKKALGKLSRMTCKLGYPEKWKSYRGLIIKPDAYFENVLNASKYERRRNFSHLGKKVDREEWFISPQVVNAFYNPNMNSITFPAGILQPPFFDQKADNAFNYGAIGSVIGHEITHGFDDEGSKFDGKGNFKNWWTKEDRKRFEQKTKKLVQQFNKYTVAGGIKINGKFTLGENIADLGGAAIAYNAYMRHLEDSERKNIFGFTPEQRFFLGLALIECGQTRPEAERTMALIDPHSPPVFRINGPVSNLVEFYNAFGVREGDALYRKSSDRAKIW